MHRTLLISDTHGHIGRVTDLLDRVPFDAIIHLGDLVSDARALAKRYPHIAVEAVRGNNDFAALSSEAVIQIASHTVFICHGHGYTLGGDFAALYEAAERAGAGLVFFGHTHCSFDKTIGNIRFFCPGSPSYPRDSEAACGILEIEGDKVSLAHYTFVG